MNATAAVLLLAGLAAPRPGVSLEGDLPRFPSLVVAEAATEFAWRYKEHARERAEHEGWGPEREQWRADWWREAAEDGYRCWYAWDCLRWAHDPRRPTADRRYWLGVLRERLSPEDWWAGRMPEVPAWRFSELPRRP